MEKNNFKEVTSKTTPVSGTNLGLLQDNIENTFEKERIQKFKDLILNEHYCEDCNELCGIGESFPLEFVTKYIIKLEKENEELEEMLKNRIKYTNELEKDLFENSSNYVIPKSKVKEIRDKAEVMDYYALPDVIKDLNKLLGEEE